jgi:hypothetical protein
MESPETFPPCSSHQQQQVAFSSTPATVVPDTLLATPLGNKRLPLAPLDSRSHLAGHFDTSATSRAARARAINCPHTRAQIHKTSRAGRQQHRAIVDQNEPLAIARSPAFYDPDTSLVSSTSAPEPCW